ncbi:MAG: cyclic-di-AMP receptor [Clostridia bacterium]|nr:cyclic-di-AMP receptor [Clostridia bacterium]
MKLIFAIVHDEDAGRVTDTLNSAEFSVTKLCSTGGFLRAGNTTLLIGVEDNLVDSVLEIIERNSNKRTECLRYPIPSGSLYIPSSKEVEVGGATIFVTSVERFEKV